MPFDEARLDDPEILAGHDALLRGLAESGARVRREVCDAEPARAAAIERAQGERPRAVVAAGPDARLLRAVLEPYCPVPFVAWPAPALPGWAGSLDLVVMLAPEGEDRTAASAVSEAVRRGCRVLLAAPSDSLVATHAQGRDTVVWDLVTGDQLATAVGVLELLAHLGLGPAVEPDAVAAELDRVAVLNSPHRDLAVNPAKLAAIALADSQPLVWGGSALAARAARRMAEALRQATGRPALAADAEFLLPLIGAARPRTVFDDPYDGADGAQPRPVLVMLDDAAMDPVIAAQAEQLRSAAAAHDVRVEEIESTAGSDLTRYAGLLLQARYIAAYLEVGRS